ncbi:MAG: hypothetical protein WAU81_07010 [Candidatus Aminicenantales bacterium]
MNSESSFDRLIKEGKLKRQKAEINYLNALLDAAGRNFEAALVVRRRVDEAAFKLFYDGLLQISRVVVLLKGYRPDDGEQHKTTFFVAGEILGPDYKALIRKIQKLRVKRNICLYDPKGLIGKTETEAMYETAKKFWNKVRSYLEKANPQLNLFEEL